MAATLQCSLIALVFSLCLPICLASKSSTDSELGFQSNTQAKPADAGSAAVMMLDTDMNGKVDRAEVEAFAKKTGLSAEAVASEFSGLDTDGDGELSSDEISSSVAASQVADAPGTSSSVDVVVAPPGSATPAAAIVAPVVHHAPVAAVLLDNASDMVAALNRAKTASSYIDAAGESDEPVFADARVEKKAVITTAPRLEKEGVFHLEAKIEANGDLEAVRALAEVFADSASGAFDRHSENEKKAVKLEAEAKSLRDRSAAIAKTAEAETVGAAERAAKAVVKEAEPQVLGMQRRAAQFEREAVERRALAEQAMMNVTRAQTEMSEILNHA